MILARNGEAGLRHFCPKPGGVVSNPLDERRILLEQVEHLEEEEENLKCQVSSFAEESTQKRTINRSTVRISLLLS